MGFFGRLPQPHGRGNVRLHADVRLLCGRALHRDRRLLRGFPKKATPQRAAWRLQHSSGAGRGMAHCSAQPPGEAATEKRGGRPLVLWRMRHGRAVSAPEPVRFSVKKSPGERLSYADPHGLIPA